ncbi:MAG: ATP-binding protein [candidate division WOR-3 bacterium]|nr:ATP-binding protein [candidate division WOR-3 bacterium]
MLSRKNLLILITLILISCNIIYSADTITVGITDTPPIVYMEEGKAAGFFVELLEHIALEEEWHLQYRMGSLNQCIERLANNEIDLIADIGFSPERESLLTFNEENILYTWAAFYTLGDSDILDYSDLHMHTIAVEKDDYFVFDRYFGLQSILDRIGVEYHFITVDEYRDVLGTVAEGEAEVGVVNQFYGKVNADKYGLTRAELKFAPVSLRYASSGEKADMLLGTIDSYVDKMKKDSCSIYYRLMEKHIEKPKTHIPLWIIIILACLLLIIIIAVILLVSRNTTMQRQKRMLEKSRHKRTQYKKTLKEINRLRNRVIDGLPVGIILLDKSHSIEYINDLALSILNETDSYPEDIDLLSFEFVNRWGKPTGGSNPFVRAIEKRQNINQEQFLLRMPAGDKAVLMSSILFSDPVDNREYGLFTIEDITEIKNLEKEKTIVEEELFQSQKVDSVGRLASGIAHDFNNILTVIQTNAEVVLMNSEKRVEDVEESLIDIINASEVAANLTGHLLLFSSRQPFTVESVNINNLLRDFINTIRRIIRSDIQIEMKLDDDIGWIIADFNSVKQIILNLIVNARDAIKEQGGAIIVGTESRTVDNESSGHCAGESMPGKYTCFYVEDNGEGIGEEIKKHMFEPFFTTKDVSKGTGLGLSVVKTLIEKQNGFLDVYTQKGKGTRFTVCFPYADFIEENNVREEDSFNDLKGNGETLLIIEDDNIMLRTAQNTLGQFNYHVYPANSASQARTIFTENLDSIDIVFTDINLPDGKGTEIADEFISKKPELKFIFTSGYIDRGFDSTMTQYRHISFIRKPYMFRTLLSEIKALLDNEHK